MRVFATRWFARFMRKERIGEQQLCEAVGRAARGSVDANLGGNLIKQRVARKGGGRRGGYRVLIAHQSGRRAVLLYGFAKNERDSIDPSELADLKKLTQRLITLSEQEIALALRANELKELHCHGESEDEV